MSTSTKQIHEPGTTDGWHGVIPSTEFPVEKDRYHLYIGYFCPFAHRANFVRHLKGLTDFIGLSIVMPYPKGDSKGWPGWRFPASEDEYPGATVDHLFGEDYLHKIYFRADPDYKGRYSVPLLWDKKSGTIVCNVSALPRIVFCKWAVGFLTASRKVRSFYAGYQRHLISSSSHRSRQSICTRFIYEHKSTKSHHGCSPT
jgi:glutathionyl-hydroquinone reductase